MDYYVENRGKTTQKDNLMVGHNNQSFRHNEYFESLYFRTNKLLFELYIARFVAKNGSQKDTCYSGIGLCAQNIDTIPGSLLNTQLEGIGLMS